MDNKQAFTDYLLHRQKEYKQGQINKQKRLEIELNSYEIGAKLHMSKNYKSRNKRAVN